MAGTARWFGPNARERLVMTETLKELLGQAPVEKTAAFSTGGLDPAKTIQVNATAAVTGTVEQSKAGTKLRLVQTGAGLLTLAAGAGVTLNTPTTLKSGGRHSTLVVEFLSATVAVVSGNLAAA